MADGFNFDLFKTKATTPFVPTRCLWVQWVPASEHIYCSNRREVVASDSDLIKRWLQDHPGASSLAEMPMELCDIAFCSIHSAMAKNATSSFRFGSKGDSKNPFQLTQPDLPSWPEDHQWGDSSDDVQSSFSDTRLLEIFGGGHTKTIEVQGRGSTAADDANKEDSRTFNERASPKTPIPLVKEEQNETRQDITPTKTQRPSLSADTSRKSVPGLKYSTDRSRSPHSRPVTPSGESKVKTMRGDGSWDRQVRDNETQVVQVLEKPLKYTDSRVYGKKGWVYAFRDPELNLVKIGFTVQKPSVRIAEIRSKCNLSTANLQAIEDYPVSVLAFKRLEELVHADLSPHRFYFECECGEKVNKSGSPREHHEWYDVSNEVAILTVQVWRSFILQDPYGALESGKSHHLQDKWIRRIRKRTEVSETEKHADHPLRLARWSTLFRLGEKGIKDAAGIPHPPGMPSVTRVTKNEKLSIKEEITSNEKDLASIPPFQTEAATTQATTKSEAATRKDVTGEDNVWTRARNQREDAAIMASQLAKPSIEVSEASVKVPMASSDNVSELLRNGHEHLPTLASSSEQIGLAFRSTGEEIPPLAKGIVSVASGEYREPARPKQRVPAMDQQASASGAQTPRPNERTSNNVRKEGIFPELELQVVLLSVQKRLHQEIAGSQGLPSRSIYTDLIRFRWPLTCLIIFVAYSPYAPLAFSAITWCIFLPFFIAELREWS